MANKKEKNEKKKRVNKTLPAIIALGGIIVLGFLIYIVAMKPNFTGNVVLDSSNNIVKVKNCRDVQEPYDYKITEQKTVQYTDKECETKKLVYKKDTGQCKQRQSGFFGLGEQDASYGCTLTNLDTEPGTFSMKIGFNVDGQELYETQSKYIYPQSSETFTVSKTATWQSCFCVENAPTKQVCRDVIKYRQVPETRTETRYRTVQKCD